MARRSTKTGLLRLLDTVTVPVYALDHDHRIVYANEACQQWCGPAVADALGQPCRYHSQADDTGNVPLAARLCPPPQALSGRIAFATIGIPRDDGQLASRQFQFIPLAAGEEDAWGVLAVASEESRADASTDSTRPVPATDDDSPSALHVALDEFRRQRRRSASFDLLAGTSLAIGRVRAQAAAAASSTANVLVVGIDGSGREAIARAIHYASPASGDPLVPLACRSLTVELLERTLRALDQRSDGANQAVLLLVDADRLPDDVQVELSAAWRAPNANYRVIGTSSIALFDEERQPRLRADLAWRLTELVIELPPLVSRLEDLPWLAQMLLESCNAAGGRQAAGFSSESLEQLAAYHWPGDVDELAEVVAYAHAHAVGPVVGPADLPRRLFLAADAERFPRKADEPIELEAFLADIERELLQRAMGRARGNKTRAARLLGMTRPRLYRRMVQLGLESESSEAEREADHE
jgi:transcriptional regulator with PAS, ATPase and Fis domain